MSIIFYFVTLKYVKRSIGHKYIKDHNVQSIGLICDMGLLRQCICAT